MGGTERAEGAGGSLQKVALSWVWKPEKLGKGSVGGSRELRVGQRLVPPRLGPLDTQQPVLLAKVPGLGQQSPTCLPGDLYLAHQERDVG